MTLQRQNGEKRKKRCNGFLRVVMISKTVNWCYKEYPAFTSITFHLFAFKWLLLKLRENWIDFKQNFNFKYKQDNHAIDYFRKNYLRKDWCQLNWNISKITLESVNSNTTDWAHFKEPISKTSLKYKKSLNRKQNFIFYFLFSFFFNNLGNVRDLTLKASL